MSPWGKPLEKWACSVVWLEWHRAAHVAMFGGYPLKIHFTEVNLWIQWEASNVTGRKCVGEERDWLLLPQNQDPWGLQCLLSSGVTDTKHLAELKRVVDDCEGHRFRCLKFLVDHDWLRSLDAKCKRWHPCWANRLLFTMPKSWASNVTPNSKCLKNFKALHGCRLWLGKRLPVQIDYAIVVHDKYSAPFFDLLMGRRQMNCVFDLLVHSPYFYVSELFPLSHTVPPVALPMLVRKSIQTFISLTVTC